MKCALAFVALVGVAVATPGSQLWSKAFTPGDGTVAAVPAAFNDGSAVVFSTPTGLTSYDQATGATLGTVVSPLTYETLFLRSAVEGLNFFMTGDGTVRVLQGPALTLKYQTSPSLEHFSFCGANEDVMVLTGRRNRKALTLFVDVQSGTTIKTVISPWDSNAPLTRCAFTGRHSMTTRSLNSSGMSARRLKGRVGKTSLTAEDAVRFHDGQAPQRIVRQAADLTTAAAPPSSSVFVRYGAMPDVITRYDYTSSGSATVLAFVWNVTATPTPASEGFIQTTLDQQTLLCGYRRSMAIDVATGKVRSAVAGLEKANEMWLYRGSLALFTLTTIDEGVIVYDYASMSVVKTFALKAGAGQCFHKGWTPTALQVLPKANVIMVWAYESPCLLAFDFMLRTTKPIGVIRQAAIGFSGFYDAHAAGTLLGFSSGFPPSPPKMTLYNTTSWQDMWTFPLPAATNDIAVGPDARRVFVDSPTEAFAYSL